MDAWECEVWVCNCGYTLPEEHDGSCGIWEQVGTVPGGEWATAYSKAATLPHGRVWGRYLPTGKAVAVFEHIAGGGLCAGCWRRHQVTHTEHVIEPDTGLCRPCIEVEKRRGPYTRTPDGREFMCEECRVSFRRTHESTAYAEGRDPDSRLYRSALDVAREDTTR